MKIYEKSAEKTIVYTKTSIMKKTQQKHKLKHRKVSLEHFSDQILPTATKQSSYRIITPNAIADSTFPRNDQFINATPDRSSDNIKKPKHKQTNTQIT